MFLLFAGADETCNKKPLQAQTERESSTYWYYIKLMKAKDLANHSFTVTPSLRLLNLFAIASLNLVRALELRLFNSRKRLSTLRLDDADESIPMYASCITSPT